MDASTPTNCFEAAPEFVDEDNRRFRPSSPVSKQQMAGKHSILLPENLVRGKTILDLGCCLGSTGHWCLSNGAAHYTGVELQPAYVETAQRLLNKYHPGKFTLHNVGIEKWLAAQPLEPAYDIVCMLGVIYVFSDYYSILKSMTTITKQTLVIEGLHIGAPYIGLMSQFPEFCGASFTNVQEINLATEKSSMWGRGTRISPKGMEWLIEEFGFKSKEGILFPPPINDVADIYNRPLTQLKAGVSVRYLMRFDRQENLKVQTLSRALQCGHGVIREW